GRQWVTSVTGVQFAKSGHTALAVLGCGHDRDSNDVAAAHAPGIRTGVIRSRTNATTVKGRPGSRAVNGVHYVHLLGGQITADAVRAVSRTSFNGTRYGGGGGRSEF